MEFVGGSSTDTGFRPSMNTLTNKTCESFQ